MSSRKIKNIDDVEQIVELNGLQLVEFLDLSSIQQFQARWREAFAWEQLRQQIRNMRGHLDWHVFSYGHCRCLKDGRALAELEKQPVSELILRVDQGSIPEAAVCRGKPALRLPPGAGSDAYLTDVELKWTFVRTHEEDAMSLGPYFSYAQLP